MKGEFNLFDDIFSSYDVDKYESEILETIEYLDQLKKDGKLFNTDTSVSLETIRLNGFNPIAITQMMLEETFVFNTLQEANQAFEKLEKELNLVSGFWFSMVDFEIAYNEYITDMNYSPKIYYLDGR